MSTAKFNQWLNPDGSENYKCRAWVNFNGTGTVAIRASGNVSSITDNGTGNYTANFTTAMPNTNYTSIAAASSDGNDNTNQGALVTATHGSTTACVVRCVASNTQTAADIDSLAVAIFR